MHHLKNLLCAALACSTLGFGGSVAAQAQPSAQAAKPITVIVPYAAGGTADVVARVLGERAGAVMEQSIVVDNRSGGDGIIGAQAGARARPDGHTLLQLSTAHAILPALRQDLPYDLRRDFVPVFGASIVPQALAVNAKSDLHSLADLATFAKSSPKGIDYASGGAGSISHLTGAFLAQGLKLRATHVAYRGLSNAVQAVLGNQVQFTVVNIPDVLELARSGSLRLLAVTSEQRLPYLPNVPTVAEQGFEGWSSSSWSAYVAPAHTPPEAVDRIYRAYATAANDPGVKERLGKLGVSFTVMNGAELGKFMANESSRWRKVIEDNQIKLD